MFLKRKLLVAFFFFLGSYASENELDDDSGLILNIKKPEQLKNHIIFVQQPKLVENMLQQRKLPAKKMNCSGCQICCILAVLSVEHCVPCVLCLLG